jgi:hypothetical protein
MNVKIDLSEEDGQPHWLSRKPKTAAEKAKELIAKNPRFQLAKTGTSVPVTSGMGFEIIGAKPAPPKPPKKEKNEDI